MKKHINIPIFIPHLGCPNQCVFCNQRTISGVKDFDISSVKEIIDSALSTKRPETSAEIAFFGGSFTGIDKDLMINLLKIANEYIISGDVQSIRCSTRPDYINEQILAILKKYGVKTIELGLQSTNESVLILTKRGHGFEAEKRACQLIIQSGFTLVGQMMLGLPGSSLESEISTADFIINSGASAVRIYPTVVFLDTELCDMAKVGLYEPLDINEAVRRSAILIKKFHMSGVKVIRVGLCASENLASSETYFSGPNHSALGELAENELFFQLMCEKIEESNLDNYSSLSVLVPIGATSKAVGQKKRNVNKIMEKFGFRSVKIKESELLSDYQISVNAEGRKKDVLKIT